MFYKHNKRYDGLQTICKKCMKTYKDTFYKEYSIKYASDYQKLDYVKENIQTPKESKKQKTNYYNLNF